MKTWLTDWLDYIVSHIEYAGIRITPAASPIPAMVALGTVLSPVWGNWGLVIVGVIEVIGLAAGAFASYIHTFNQSGKGYVNPNWGWGVMAGYFLIVEAAIVAFKLVPAILAPNPIPGAVTQAAATMLFPFLTLIGAVIIGIRIQMEKTEHQVGIAQVEEEVGRLREQNRLDALAAFDLETKKLKRDQEMALEREQAAQKAELDRVAMEHKLMLQQQRIATRSTTVARPSRTPVRNKKSNNEKFLRQAQLQQALQHRGFIIPNQYANEIGKHRSVVLRDLQELASAGLAHKNDKGWKPGGKENEQHTS
jgi:hypothetical protein